jgi:type II secretory pathway component PulF
LSQFTYKAVDRAGAHVAGVVDAADRRSAVATLTGRGHLVTELIEKGQARVQAAAAAPVFRLPRWGGRVSSKDIYAMTTQLSTAVRAGLPLLNCLSCSASSSASPACNACSST